MEARVPAESTRQGFNGQVAVEEISDLAGFETLRGCWSKLLKDNPSDALFTTWEWGRTWWKHLGGNRRLRLLAVRRDGVVVGIAPLVVVPPRPRKLWPFRTLELAGRGPIGPDYLNLVVRGSDSVSAIGAMAESVAESREVIVLSGVAAGPSPVFRLAQSLEKTGWRVMSRSSGVCPGIHLEGYSWETYLASLGSSHRQNVRRRLRRICRDFSAELIEAGTEVQRRRCLRDFERLHHKRWAPSGGSDSITVPKVMDFHDEFSRLALERGWLRLFVLRLDGRPAASIYGFFYGDVFYFYQSGFDPDFASYSVGLVAMALSIQKAISEGARCFDLLHGSERYKYLWANDRRDLVTYECYPPGLRGSLARRMVRMRSAAKRAAGRPAAPFRAGASLDVAND